MKRKIVYLALMMLPGAMLYSQTAAIPVIKLPEPAKPVISIPAPPTGIAGSHLNSPHNPHAVTDIQ